MKEPLVDLSCTLELAPGERLTLPPDMIDPHEFARMQLELTAEFGKFVFDHPEVDETLPDGSFVYFEIAGEPEFNRYSRELAAQQQREEAEPIVVVRVKGLTPPQGSRLIDPVIESLSALV